MEIIIKKYTILIDDEDKHLIDLYKWKSQTNRGRTYFVNIIQKDYKQKVIRLHRLIMGLTSEFDRDIVVDHINGDFLDNRKSNLRITTASQNAINSKNRKNNTSGYKGVYYKKCHKKFVARIGVKMTRVFLGYFSTAEEAAKAYDEAAKQYHGEYAVLNFSD